MESKSRSKRRSKESKDVLCKKPVCNSRLLVFVLAVAVVLVAIIGFRYFNAGNNTGSIDLFGSAVKQGDVVQVDYTGKFRNGTVFDTSLQEVAVDAGIYNPMRDYGPMVLTVGLGEVIKGFDEGLVGLKAGEEKIITIPPEKGYGEWSSENIEVISRVQNTSRIEEIPIDMFENATGEKAVVGKTIQTPGLNWPMELVDIENGTVFVRHNPVNGTTVPTALGNASLYVTEDRIYARLEVETGQKIASQMGVVKIYLVNETSVVLDTNHELAGQTIIFQVKVVSINKVTDPYAEQMQAGQIQY